MCVLCVPRNAVVEKQNCGVRFCWAVGSLMISRGRGRGPGGCGVLEEAKEGEGEGVFARGSESDELGRLDQNRCATLSTVGGLRKQ